MQVGVGLQLVIDVALVLFLALTVLETVAMFVGLALLVAAFCRILTIASGGLARADAAHSSQPRKRNSG